MVFFFFEGEFFAAGCFGVLVFGVLFVYGFPLPKDDVAALVCCEEVLLLFGFVEGDVGDVEVFGEVLLMAFDGVVVVDFLFVGVLFFGFLDVFLQSDVVVVDVSFESEFAPEVAFAVVVLLVLLKCVFGVEVVAV